MTLSTEPSRASKNIIWRNAVKDIYTQKGRIFDIQKFSVHDGSGIRTIVFLKAVF